MKNLWLATAIMLLASTVSATTTKKNGDENNIETMSKELALSDEQTAKIRELRQKNEGERKLNLKKVEEAQASFLTTTGNAKATSAEILQSYNDLQIAKATHNRNGFEEVIAIREFMNETQRIKFHNLVIKNLKK